MGWPLSRPGCPADPGLAWPVLSHPDALLSSLVQLARTKARKIKSSAHLMVVPLCIGFDGAPRVFKNPKFSASSDTALHRL